MSFFLGRFSNGGDFLPRHTPANPPPQSSPVAAVAAMSPQESREAGVAQASKPPAPTRLLRTVPVRRLVSTPQRTTRRKSAVLERDSTGWRRRKRGRSSTRGRNTARKAAAPGRLSGPGLVPVRVRRSVHGLVLDLVRPSARGLVRLRTGGGREVTRPRGRGPSKGTVGRGLVHRASPGR